jgi:hypothetical protein
LRGDGGSILSQKELGLGVGLSARRRTNDRGEDIYQGAFVYPPINAWLVIPFAYLPNIAGRLIWLAMNLVALIVLVRTAWKLSAGGRLDGEPPVPRREHVIFGIGLVCGLAFIFDTLTTQQTDLVVAAIVLLGSIVDRQSIDRGGRLAWTRRRDQMHSTALDAVLALASAMDGSHSRPRRRAGRQSAAGTDASISALEHASGVLGESLSRAHVGRKARYRRLGGGHQLQPLH